MQIVRTPPLVVAASLLLGFTAPALAFHRSSPPVIGVTTSGDTDLPRIRFVMEVAVPVVRGTRRIRESREE